MTNEILEVIPKHSQRMSVLITMTALIVLANGAVILFIMADLAHSALPNK